MKPLALISGRTMIPLLGALLLVVASASAGPTNSTAPKTNSQAPGPKGKSTPAAEPATNVVVEIPKSVFIIPTNDAAGKDPFFPRSPYPYGATVATSRTNPIVKLPELTLNGISGTAEKPLAIINYVTFGVDDTREVPVGTKKVMVRCLEINLQTSTAVVLNGGQRQTLRLNSPVNLQPKPPKPGG